MSCSAFLTVRLHEDQHPEAPRWRRRHRRCPLLRRPDTRPLAQRVRASIGPIVVITNSTAQLTRLILTAHQKAPALVGQPEYRFFRDRYPHGEEDETGLPRPDRRDHQAPVRPGMADRLLSPGSRRGRLGSNSRRRTFRSSRARWCKSAVAQAPAGSIDLGPLHLVPGGRAFGDVRHARLPDPDRRAAPGGGQSRRGRGLRPPADTYQQTWRGVFDPIAARFSSVRAGGSPRT